MFFQDAKQEVPTVADSSVLATEENETLGFECEICNKQFLHAVSKSAHLKLAHKLDVSASPSLLSNISLPSHETFFKCKICSESFPSKALRNSHLKANHAGLDCHYCHKKFVFESNLRKHISLHRVGKVDSSKLSSLSRQI